MVNSNPATFIVSLCLLHAAIAQANKEVASEPLLDLPMNLVKGQTFPNFQFFGGDIEASVMQYSLLQNLTPLPVAINMIAQQVRAALGPDSEAYGQPKKFLFFVDAAVVTQNEQDERKAPYWSNTVPNLFASRICKEYGQDHEHCYERAVKHIDDTLDDLQPSDLCKAQCKPPSSTCKTGTGLASLQ